MPIEYVIAAYSNANKVRMRELHEYERPHALHMSMVANHNRDPDYRSEPFKPEDFYLYQPVDLTNLPDDRYGSAALALIEQQLFPSWALFCYKDLSARSSGTPPPLLALISDDAILLAPTRKDNGFTGLLIANEVAGDQWTLMRSPCGMEEMLFIPKINAKVIATEDVILSRR